MFTYCCYSLTSSNGERGKIQKLRNAFDQSWLFYVKGNRIIVERYFQVVMAMKFNFVWEWWSNFRLRYPFLSRFKEFWNCCRKRRKLFKLISLPVYRSTLVQRPIWTNLVHLINSNFKILEKDEGLTNEERILSYDIVKKLSINY